MHIFISYAKKDTRELAFALNDALNALDGVTAWVDKSIIPGRNWVSEIQQQIELCEWMVVLISPDVNRPKTESQDESFVRDEIQYARFTAHKSIVPVMALPTTPPLELTKAHYIPYADHTREGIGWLVNEICHSIGITISDPPADPVPVERVVDRPAPLIEDVYALIDRYFEARDVGQWEAAFGLLKQIERTGHVPLSFPLDDYQREVSDELQRILDDYLLKQEAEKAESRRRQLEAASAREYDFIRKLVQRDPARVANALAKFRQTYPFYGDPEELLFKMFVPPPFVWIEIPAGPVTLITEKGWEKNYIPEGETRTFDVAAFFIAKYPITNAQFQIFVDEPDGYREPGWWDYSPAAQAWRSENAQPHDTAFPGDDLPRTKVCWYEAIAFCRWLSEKTGQNITLPIEQQWQRAAQGDDNRTYPWGNQPPNKTLCNFNDNVGRATPVTQYPKGASPYGVMDMSGNVWEWCLTEYESGRSETDGGARRVVRGCSWDSARNDARAVSRDGSYPLSRNHLLGFRLVRVPHLKGFSDH